MKIFQKSIATLLIICMMISLMPGEYLTNVFAGDVAVIGTGSRTYSVSALKNKNNEGLFNTDVPTIRVYVSRAKENYWDGTDAGMYKIKETYAYTYPTVENNLSFFFIPFDLGYMSNLWDYGNQNKIFVTEYDTSTDDKLFNLIDNPYFGNMVFLRSSGVSENIFKNNVLKDSKITSKTDLKGVWQNYLMTDAEALKICSYLFNCDATQVSIDEHIKKFIGTSKSSGKYLYELKKEEMSDQDSFENDLGFLGILTAMYKLSISGKLTDGNVVNTRNADEKAEISSHLYAAIEDYISMESLTEKPVSIVIDTAVPLMLKDTDGFRRVCMIPSIEYCELLVRSRSEYTMKDSEAGVFESLVKEKYPDAAGSLRNLLGVIAKESVANHSTDESYATVGEGGYLRLADYWGDVKSHYWQSGFIWAQKVPQFNHCYMHIKKDGTYTVGSGFDGGSDFFGFMDKIFFNYSVRGFYLVTVGVQAQKPTPPNAEFTVVNNLTVLDSNCTQEETGLANVPEMSILLKGDTSFLNYIESIRNDASFELKFIPEKTTIYRTIYQHGNTDEVIPGGARTEITELEDFLESLTKEDLIRYFKGEPIALSDNDPALQNMTFKKQENGGQTYQFKYEINLGIKLGKEEYIFNSADIVTKTSNGVSQDYTEVTIPAMKTTIEGPEDIEIPKPSSVDTTEVVDPSENEKLAENTQYVTGYDFYTTSIGFAELKSNEPLDEKYEVMGGIPSTEELYFSVGGNEFALAMVCQYWMNEHSRDRTYTVHFNGTTCEYNNQEVGKGDTWNGKITIPAATGGSISGTWNHEGGTITATWTGQITNNATAVTETKTSLHSASVNPKCPAQVDNSAYTEAISNANSWMAAMSSTFCPQIHWLSASDKVDRKIKMKAMNLGTGGATTAQGASGGTSDSDSDGGWFVANAVCSFSNPADTEASDSKSVGCSAGKDTPCGNEQATATATANPDGPKPYSITVTYTLKPHAVCGPCCGHMLPDLYDTWKQGLVFDYVKISQIRLFKLDQGLIEDVDDSEMVDLIGTTKVFANVITGNPTYFMNIAELTERNTNGKILPFSNTSNYYDRGHLNKTGLLTGEGFESDTVFGTNYDEYRRISQSSRDGRIRYTISEGQSSQTFTIPQQGTVASYTVTFDPNTIADPTQHDDIIVEMGLRSQNCDGMATTNNFGKSSSNNVTPMETTGHVNKWADGSLYTNILKKTNYSNYWLTGSAGLGFTPLRFRDNDERAIGGKYGTYASNKGVFTPTSADNQYYEDYNHHVQRNDLTEKTGYSDKADDRDIKTPEWKVFNAARRTKVVATVISDFLILQTSGGDQSIFYFEKATKPTETQEHFQKLKITDDEAMTQNPLSVFNANRDCSVDTANSLKPEYVPKDGSPFIVIGGYNGQYDDPENKYKPYSLVKDVYLPFVSDDGSGAEATYDAINKTGNYQYWGGNFIKTTLNNDPAKTIVRPARQATSQESSFKIYQDNIQIIPTTADKWYRMGTAKVWYQQELMYFTVAAHIVSSRTKSEGTQHVLSNVALGNYQFWQISDKQAALGAEAEKALEFGSKRGLSYVTKYYQIGNGAKSIQKVNDVIVFTPVSTEDALILNQNDIVLGDGSTISRDQRVNDADFPDMNELVNKLKVCPLDARLCEFKTLDCKFLEPVKLGDFNFDGTGNSGRYVVNKITNESIYIGSDCDIVPLKGSKGLHITNRGWSISFDSLKNKDKGVEKLSNDKANIIQVNMDLTVPNLTKETMIVGFKNIGFILTPKDKIGSFVLADNSKIQQESQYRVNSFDNVHLELIIGLNNIIDCSATVNGIKTEVKLTELRLDYQTKIDGGNKITEVVEKPYRITNKMLEMPENFEREDIGNVLHIGSWGNSNGYSTDFYIDNLEIYLKHGVETHTSLCYEKLQTHKTTWVHEHNDDCKLEEDVYTCNGVLNANYQCNGIKNVHEHTSACYTNISNNSEKVEQNHSLTKEFVAKTNGTINIVGYGSCSVEHWKATLTINGVEEWNYNSNSPGSHSYDFKKNDVVKVYVYSYDSCTVGWNVSWTNGSFGELTGSCTGVLNAHKHLGTAGTDSPNGCYTKPIQHKHNQSIKTLTCTIPEGGTGEVQNFDYTGNIQSVTLAPGRYKLEVWGAQGGTGWALNGNLGGYASGEYTINTPTVINIYVGGKGVNNGAGGWNGGGNGYNGGGHSSGGGGGATDIRIGGSALSNRIIVAGGGGGGGHQYYTDGQGGSGTLGIGQNGGEHDRGGGGGGYYGGKCGGSMDYSGQDGSNYVGGVLNSSNSYRQRSGNGYAKITNLDHTHTDSCYTSTAVSCSKISKGELICDGTPNQVAPKDENGNPCNIHEHNFTCLTKNVPIESRLYTYKNDEYQMYTVPYTGIYEIEVYAPANEHNQSNYIKAQYRLTKGTLLYLYVGSSKSNFNGKYTDVRLMSYNPKQTGDTITDSAMDSLKKMSEDSRLLWASTTNTGYANSKTSYKFITKSTGVIGNDSVKDGKGRIKISYVEESEKTIYQQIIDGDLSDEVVKKYLGVEVYNKIKVENGGSSAKVVFNSTVNDRVQVIDLNPGEYTVEMWGASGGGTQTQTEGSHAGLGGYTKGNWHLNGKQRVYIYAGGQGTASSGLNVGGGWNGGGHGGAGGYGGGGASDIRTTTVGGVFVLNNTSTASALSNISAKSLMQENGSVTFGPYITAPAGLYQVDIFGKGLSSCTFDVYDNAFGGVVFNNSQLINKVVTDTHVSFYFDWNKNSVASSGKGLEVRTHHSGSTYKFDSLVLTRLTDRIMVAGGGGGSDNSGGALGPSTVSTSTTNIGFTDCQVLTSNGVTIYNNSPIHFAKESNGFRIGFDGPNSGGYNIAEIKNVYTSANSTNITMNIRGYRQDDCSTQHRGILEIGYGPAGSTEITQVLKTINSSTYWSDSAVESITLDTSSIPVGNTIKFKATKKGSYYRYYFNVTDIVANQTSIFASDDGSGGSGGGLNGGAGYIEGVAGASGLAKGGTQSSGYKLGLGESATVNTDTGGAGGGYYGGKVSNHNNGGAGGGSGYINHSIFTTNTLTQNGKRSGKGLVKITKYSSFIGCGELIKKYFDLIPTYVDGEENPIFACKSQELNDHICITKDGKEICKIYTRLKCTEPHHTGNHYAPGEEVHGIQCWKACGDNSKHANTKTEVIDNAGNTVRLAKFLQLDLGFVVYFPNRGDFAGGDRLGLSKLSYDREFGYTNNMDTTNFTREKRVRFPFDVIYEDNIYTKGTWIDLYVPQEYFNFYLLVENPEMSNASVEFEVEAINCRTGVGNSIMRTGSGSLSYDTLKDETYKKSVKKFIEEYLNVLAEEVNKGYQITHALPSGNNRTGTVAFANYGIQNFFTGKADKLEKNNLDKAMKDTNTSMSKQFAGSPNAYDYYDTEYNTKIETHALENRNNYITGGGSLGKTINHKVKSKTTNDNKNYTSNRLRFDSYSSLHGGYKRFYLDVIGRIGNFTISDTEDFRFSNFFKTPIVSKGQAGYEEAQNWLVEGLVVKVDDSRQNLYIGDTYNIRGEKASAETLWLNTYGTQSWKNGQRDSSGKQDIEKPNLISQILTADVNNIDVLKTEQLRFGYDIYTSIDTIGSYANGKIQVIPKFYALKLTNKPMSEIVDFSKIPTGYTGIEDLKNLKKNDFVPLDVYIDKDGLFTCVNAFNNVNGSNINVKGLDMYDYVYNLDWTTESLRRNYSGVEKFITDSVGEFKKLVVYDENNPDVVSEVIEMTIPKGRNNYIGTAQYSILDAKHRTFIGSSNSYGFSNKKLIEAYNGEKSYFGIKDTSLADTYVNAEDHGIGAIKDGEDNNYIIDEISYLIAAQRWHGKLGVPSSSVFVPTGMDVDTDTTNIIMNDEFAIICTAEIICTGDVWTLAYSQPWFKTLTINGEKYSTSVHYPGHRNDNNAKSACSSCLPPIIAVYSSNKSSVGDVEIVGTH